ncbi:WbqC family protein [Paenibacillus sp. FSL M7-0420]|uniref:WbqC family protein n=1 Tax=Paenibacillus sp. FSL M7-0420 TaxID=2921609 RepID=UPI0030F88E9C
MKLGIMQPYLFAYIGYWQLLNTVDKYVIYDDVNYIKSGWINRNRILLNGEPQMINIKLSGVSSNKQINEVEIIKDKSHIKKLLKTIELSYSKAPYFLDVMPILEQILEYKEINLAAYIENSIEKICSYLKIDTILIRSSDISKDNNLRGQDKVIEICKILGADEYYNAIGGQDLYSAKTFSMSNIDLKILKTRQIQYPQFKDNFVPNLSIIDVMMFNSIDNIKEQLDMYEII